MNFSTIPLLAALVALPASSAGQDVAFEVSMKMRTGSFEWTEPSKRYRFVVLLKDLK